MTLVTRLVASTLVAGLLAGSVLLGQEQTRFRSGVDVILIDVNVVDRTGKPIPDLKPEDFHVTVDRKPRTIASAVFLEYGMRLTAIPAGAAPGPPAPAAPSATRPSRPPRQFIIVVDEDSLSTGEARGAAKAAATFLDRLVPTDRVAVLTLPRVQQISSLTTDRAEARKVLDRVIGSLDPIEPTPPLRIGLSEAFDIMRGDQGLTAKVLYRNCVDKQRSDDPEIPAQLPAFDQVCIATVQIDLRRMVTEAQARASATIEALRDLALELGKIPGPKTLVLVSGGMATPESTGSYSELEKALATAQVAMYTIFIDRPDHSAASNRPSPSPILDNNLWRYGAEDTTAAAGGAFQRVIGQIESSFDRLAIELSGSWLLGIEVDPKDRDRKPHLVQVAVSRPGLDVRARKQYVIEPDLPSLRDDAVGRPGAAPPAAAPRPAPAPSPLAGVTATPPELEPLLEQAAEYVRGYQRAFAALTAEERQEMKVSRWMAAGLAAPGSGAWVVETARVLRADYLLVKSPSSPGWRPFRDVFEVDGQPIRERDGRLRALFLQSPSDIVQSATAIDEESASHQIGFVDRNVNAPAIALEFVLPPRQGFVFLGQGEQVIDGVPVRQVAYAERATRTIVQGRGGNLPAEGTLWIDPRQGRIVKSVLRLRVEDTDAEITVTYRPTGEPGGIWVPTEISENYLGRDVRFEAVSRYSNFRKFEIDGEARRPRPFDLPSPRSATIPRRPCSDSSVFTAASTPSQSGDGPNLSASRGARARRAARRSSPGSVANRGLNVSCLARPPTRTRSGELRRWSSERSTARLRMASGIGLLAALGSCARRG